MRKLEVHYTQNPGSSLHVGTLAEHEHRIYFEYAASFLQMGFELSPFKLRRAPGLIEHTDRAFGPLPGLFDDALPDGWGRLLMDRAFRSRGTDPRTRSPLDRLAYIGSRAMGALTFHPPDAIEEPDRRSLDLRALGEHAAAVYSGEARKVLAELLRAGGSPAGARPKVLVGLRGEELISGADNLPAGFEPWIIKFAAQSDQKDAGPLEFAYARMAAAAGIDMPETRLFNAGKRRYFGVKRFDRLAGNRRVHVHSFANLIHADFRLPSTDYEQLLNVTKRLTRDHNDVLKAARRMVFNVAAHNRDDHAKNFAFTMNGSGVWSLSPAYDVIHSTGPGGEHMMSVAGEGKEPARAHLLRAAKKAEIKATEFSEICDRVNESIGRWKHFAEEAGCSAGVTRGAGKSLRMI